MALYVDSGITVDSWVEMEEELPIRHEVDHVNDQATLFFGARDTYVLHLGRENLRSVAELARAALAELESHVPTEDD